MEIEIKYTDSDAELHGVKCSVYGESGVGKTRLIATAPTPIVISAEHGLMSLREQHIPYIEVSTIDDMQSVFDWFEGSKEAKKYKTIGFDTITEVAEKLLQEIKPTVKDKRNAYGQTADAIGNMLRAFRDLKGWNVVFNSHMRKIEDEDIGITYFVPMLPGKVLPQGLPYLVDEIFCMQIQEEGTYGEDGYERYAYLQTYSTQKIIAKDRSGCLDDNEEPNLTNIFNKIIKGMKPDVKGKSK